MTGDGAAVAQGRAQLREEMVGERFGIVRSVSRWLDLKRSVYMRWEWRSRCEINDGGGRSGEYVALRRVCRVVERWRMEREMEVNGDEECRNGRDSHAVPSFWILSSLRAWMMINSSIPGNGRSTGLGRF